MGLAAGEFNEAERLKGLVAKPALSNRTDIYLAVVSLFRGQGERLSGRERALMCEILSRIAPHVELGARTSLAKSLAGDPDAPAELVLCLAHDGIEVARALILRSPQLTDNDLIGLIAAGSEAHKIACAERPHIAETVTAALTATGSERVLRALAGNRSARFSSRPLAGEIEPMPEPVPSAFGSIVSMPADGRTQAESDSLVKPNVTMLVEKLASAGQLRAGFLLRVLQQQQFELFDLAFAKLLELDLSEFRRKFYAEGPKAVALACRAVGIDRSVFPTVFDLSRAGHRTRAFLTPDERLDVEDAFSRFSKIEAKARLQGAARA